ncbi:4-hydroxy-3-methylbut-2-enyl diphosphate reductase [Spirochaetota bacterium]|nr:4-hydroxy-3-methylbut-2-enyl diphosphate reductase [Spirochaetota bacterium]
MKLLLASPRGFCAGVERAIDTVEQALKRYKPPIYVRHEIVHNRFVVETLKAKGVRFVEELDEVPDGALVIFSAHGVAQNVYDEANKRQLKFIDATCPLVRKVHFSIARYAKKQVNIILIGHADHVEVIGTMGQLPKGHVHLVQNTSDVAKLDFPHDTPLAYTTQTTLSTFEIKDIIAALKRKYPNIMGPDSGDLCYATTNRQQAVIDIVKQVQSMIIVGSSNSSNSTRLKEIAVHYGIPAYLVNRCDDLNETWFKDMDTVGISSGASAPEYLVQDIVKWFTDHYTVEAVKEHSIVKENIRFPLPLEVR